MRWVRAGLLAAIAAAWMPGVAHGQGFAPCEPAGTLCATVQVPLDRSGAVPGVVDLAVRRRPATSGTSSGVVVYLTGGPGSPVISRLASIAERIAPALASRDLVLFDYRGLGLSSPISCNIRGGSAGFADTRACAESLGVKRAFYTSRDTADDVEAVRQAIGVERIALYSISYGAVAAYDYASRYPQHVEWLVLDSPVPPGGFDPYKRSAAGATGRVLRSVCRKGGCRRITRDPVADLAKLTAQTRTKRTLAGRVVGANGRPRSISIRPADLWNMTLSSDLNPLLRLELPAAFVSALRGDLAPLLRVHAQNVQTGSGGQEGSGLNRAINRATLCEDSSTLPWARDSTPEIEPRAKTIDAALAGMPASDFAPFHKLDPVGGESSLNSCITWLQSARLPHLDEAPVPDVPALVLAGEHDLRTPLSDSQALVARFPRGQLVLSEYTGHGVLASAPSSAAACVRTAFERFVTGASAATTCAAPGIRFPPVPRAPTSLGDVAPVRGLGGIPGRTLAAVLQTLDDAQYAFLASASEADKIVPIGGLRGGRMSGSLDRARLAGLSYVPKVKVSGTFDLNKGLATVTVSGSGARGSVRLTKTRLTGKLGGRRFSLRRPARPIALAG